MCGGLENEGIPSSVFAGDEPPHLNRSVISPWISVKSMHSFLCFPLFGTSRDAACTISCTRKTWTGTTLFLRLLWSHLLNWQLNSYQLAVSDVAALRYSRYVHTTVETSWFSVPFGNGKVRMDRRAWSIASRTSAALDGPYYSQWHPLGSAGVRDAEDPARRSIFAFLFLNGTGKVLTVVWTSHHLNVVML